MPKPDDRTGKPMASSWKLLEDPANFPSPVAQQSYGAAGGYGQYGGGYAQPDN